MINRKFTDRDEACTLATDLHAQGQAVAVYQDTEGVYRITHLSAAYMDNLPWALVYDPTKGTPVVTDEYRGPERRKGSRVETILPVFGIVKKAGTA